MISEFVSQYISQQVKENTRIKFSIQRLTVSFTPLEESKNQFFARQYFLDEIELAKDNAEELVQKQHYQEKK